MSRVSQPTTTFRNPTKALGCVVAGILVALLMTFILAFGRPGGVDLLEVVLGLAGSVFLIVRVSRCGIYADVDGIRVLNPLSTTRLPWDEIRRFELAERGSSRIERVDGSTVKAFGIQHSMADTMRSGRRTLEAAMIDELNARLTSPTAG